MKTISASDANREFSRLLREAGKGEEITILSRGRPVAKITSIDSLIMQRKSMKSSLVARLKSQPVTTARKWTRAELYE